MIEPFLTTFTGKQFHYRCPTVDEIDIQDIAHALSLLCRFTGHSRFFYSVSEHSVRVAELVSPELRLRALLHDAAEAYTSDISTPVKETHRLDVIETKISQVIQEKFGLVPNQANDNVVKHFDKVLLATEARDLLPNTVGWRPLPEPLPDIIYPWTSDDAEKSFLTYFQVYGGIIDRVK